MALGYDPFDPDIIPPEDAFNQFFWQLLGYVIKNIRVDGVHLIVGSIL